MNKGIRINRIYTYNKKAVLLSHQLINYKRYYIEVIRGIENPGKINTANDNIFWVQCDNCDKWRISPVKIESEFWICQHNFWNLQFANCRAPDQSLHLANSGLISNNRFSKGFLLRKSQSVNKGFLYWIQV